ncbi:MAG: cobyric acid synthase [Bacilli bacterium]
MARSLMFVGTASNVGKSVICTAMCRILHRDGHRVAPFKSQNMSLNSAVTPSGREIGRAQAVQAEACGILPNEHMNPVLLKPIGGTRSQVVVQGRIHDTRSARDYFFDRKEEIWEAVLESYRFLAQRYDVIVIEGAGSPVEMNLKPREIANMRTAEMADASVILVADIDRGGVFASVVGTLQLLEPHERARVKGVIVNKFRGDPGLFEDGRRMLGEYAGVPVLGVIPYIRDLGIDEEDSVGLAAERYRGSSRSVADLDLPTDRRAIDRANDRTNGGTNGGANGLTGGGSLRVAIVDVPHIANFTDFDPLFLEPCVQAYFCRNPEDMRGADAVILPGTKSTMGDLEWLWTKGWPAALREAQECGARLFGVCGGYQMLGERVRDPHLQESDAAEYPGLGLLDGVTTLFPEKVTVLVEGELSGDFSGIAVQGYEIHMGRTVHGDARRPFALTRSPSVAGRQMEGAVSADGRTMGTYLHGIFHNDVFRTAWLNRIRSERGLPEQGVSVRVQEARDAAYDRLETVMRKHLDLAYIYRQCL